MAQEKFGWFAVNQRLRVSKNGVRVGGKASFISTSVGFKQQDGTWDNVFVDVVCTGDTLSVAANLQPGDFFVVNGRVDKSPRDYNGKHYEGWKIWAETITIEGQQNQYQQPRQSGPDDAPKFYESDTPF